MRLQVIQKWLGVILFISIFWGCKRDIETTWDAEYATPIAQAELDLGDLVGDSIIVKNGDNSLDLVYDYTLAVDSIDEYLNVRDTLQEKSVTLGKIVLDNRTLSDTITLGEIYPLSKLLDGQTQNLPAFDQDGSNNKQEIDITKQFFKQAKFKKGYIDMVLSNDLPVEAEKLVFVLKNKSDGAIILEDSFLNVLPNTSVKSTRSLAGVKMDGVLIGIVKRVKTKASSGPVLIDSKKGIRIDLAVRDIEFDYATAIFPSQNLVEENQEVKYNFGKADLSFIVIKSGYLIMEVFSNVKEEIILDYEIPNSSRNNNFSENVKQTVKVPPAPEGSFSKVVKKFPLDNYEVYMLGEFPNTPPYKFSTVFSKFTARIEYSGIERTLSLADSVFVRFGLVEIKPRLAIGDFGYHYFNFDQTQSVKFFENVKGNISLEDVKMSLNFKNSFGIESDVYINNLTGVNTRNNTSVKLVSSVMPPVFTLQRAKNNPFVSFKYGMNFDQNNSNIKQFLENMPDKMETKFGLLVRPRGSNDYTDFVFDTSQITANLRLEMPVQIGTDGLELSQIQNFNFMSFNKAERIKSGVLKLDISNGYPFEAFCNVEFLDEGGRLITTLYETGAEQVILPGIIDGNNMVSKPLLTALYMDIPEGKMNLIKNAKKIRIKTKFNTPAGNRYKIYSTYKFGVKVKANFIYEQSF